jgi:tripartite-type tricarboxylate transporter receptor subunit TctC
LLFKYLCYSSIDDELKKGDFVMKKFFIYLGVISLLLLLVSGCSGSQSAQSTDTSGNKTSTDSSNESANKSGSKYPERPVTIIVPWGTGGGSDQMTRALAKAAESTSDVKFVIQNMPGAAGLTGLNYVMQQPADGYVLYEVLTDQLVQMATKETEFTMNDIVPVIQSQAILNFLYIKSSDDRFTNFEELVKYAKEHDGEVKVGTTGLNSFDAVMLSAIESKYGFKFKNVPFNKPAERFAALSGGFIDVLFEQIGDVSQFIESGDWKPVIVYNDKRMEEYPDVPTTVENGINETTPYSRGIWAKKDTPKEVLEYLDKLFKQATETEEWKAFNNKQKALDTSFQDNEGFKALMEETYKKLEATIK